MTAPIPLPPIPPRWAVAAVMASAEAAGWTEPEAFRAALLLLLHGVTVAQACALFERCEEVKQ